MAAFQWTLANSLLIVPFFFLGKWLLRNLLAWYLRRKAAARRTLALAHVKIEEGQFQLAERHSPKSDEGEWEKVEGYASGSAANGGQAEDEWEGVVGFFHPFWQAETPTLLMNRVDTD